MFHFILSKFSQTESGEKTKKEKKSLFANMHRNETLQGLAQILEITQTLRGKKQQRNKLTLCALKAKESQNRNLETAKKRKKRPEKNFSRCIPILFPRSVMVDESPF